MRIILSLFLFLSLNLYGQTIKHRLILLGDAGEINEGQRLSIQKASELIIAEQTSVYFLGDNIYPLGMGLDSANASEGQQILQSQFAPFTTKSAAVTFIAGNHDWDKSGKLGLEKVRAQEAYLNSKGIASLTYLPKAGTAEIAVVNPTNATKLLLYDSEYWLFPNHQNADSALSEKVRTNFLSNLKSELTQNPASRMLIISHHPMISFGEHGKNITWKDHIFPLTRKWKNLYLPLPILGSLYPLIRTKIFYSAEDLTHPIYQKLKADITTLTAAHKDVVFIAGHDHGLQLIQDNTITQIVTGSGSKTSHIAHHHSQRFVSNHQGFCVLDILSNEDIAITFYTVDKGKVTKAFESILPKK